MSTLPAHRFKHALAWTGAEKGPAKDVRTYSRDYEIQFDGRPTIAGSAAPGFRGDASRINPEELFLASLSACQMLTYLALAARAGVEVIAYEDDGEAELGPIEGVWKITKIILRPRITISAGDPAQAEEIVEKAHEGCFIARSVSCPVEIKSKIVTA